MMPILTIGELAKLTSAEIFGDSLYEISGVANLEEATSSEVSFLENPRYETHMRSTQAGAIFVPPGIDIRPGKNFLVTNNPSLAFQKAIEFFIQPAPSGFSDIHPTAVIHPKATIGSDVSIGPYAVIDQGVAIGDRSVIGPHCYIGPESILGTDCYLYPHVMIYNRSKIGHRVILQSGCVIGSSGFGYATDKSGTHHPLKQLGIVVLEDDVEIGANTTIDRARFKETRIKKGSKIDNLVQIAHQVEIGENNLIIAQVGIAGSTKTGKNVILAGQVGIIGHINIADNVVMAARAAATKSIVNAGLYSGAPAIPIREFNEQAVHIKNLKKLVKRVEAIEKQPG